MIALCGLSLPNDTESPCGGFMVPCLLILRNEQRTGHSVTSTCDCVGERGNGGKAGWMNGEIVRWVYNGWVVGWVDR